MGDATPDKLIEGLARACSRAGLSPPSGLVRLTGGATMESWRFSAGADDFVLRRAPSLAFMADRPFGHDTEAALIRAARAAGVTAPEVIAELEAEDAIGSGFVMRALPGTADPRAILEMEEPGALLAEAARDLARIHTLRPRSSGGAVPDAIPLLDTREAIADLRAQFLEAGGDRPIIALGLKWMEENCPPPADRPVLVHGDYRMGNLLAEAPGRLAGVLDWELAHFGDPHEDLAFGCMAVWRFHRYDRPALGLGSLEEYFAAYEEESGTRIDPDRFRYWLVHRTVWWALGCLKCAKVWRDGSDRMLERVVISRRTSENELDLLMLLEADAPEEERALRAEPLTEPETRQGEATSGELARAISEWLETLKPKMEGHDRFQLAVARNALGMIARDEDIAPRVTEPDLAEAILAGSETLASPGLLRELKEAALEKLAADVPRYPALEAAWAQWAGEE